MNGRLHNGHRGELLDRLAKDLARPVSRSRALRTLGSAVVAATVPTALTSRAWGRTADGCNASGGGCISSARCCYGSDGYAVSCCPWYFTCRPSGLCGEPFACEDGRGFCGPKSGRVCCPPSQVCFKGVCVTPCPPDQVVCKGICCPKGTECVRATVGGQRIETCTPKCPGGRARCGLNCCPTNWRCVDPDRSFCKKCGIREEECGTRCCDKATSYCGDPSRSLCCPKNASSCPTGPVEKPRRTCCRKPNRCTQQLPPTIGGITAASPYVCCPPERQVPGAEILCCAPGQVSLGGKVLAGSGIQGLCCKRSQICGSGNDVTCCQTFSPLIGTDLNQTCCSGKCVTLNYDPSNCGACGRACPPGQRCARGVCTA